MKTAALVFALPALLLAGDFWKDKSPADWSEKEAKKMTEHSPWARETTPRMEGGMASGMPSGGRGGRGGRGGGMPGGDMGGGDMGGGGGGGGMSGGGMSGGGGMQSLPNVKVRWDSAAPVREAFAKLDVQNPFPKELAERAAGYYVITVEGMRVQMGRPQGGAQGGRPQGQQRQQGETQTLTKEDLQRMQERMLQATTLVRKDKEPMKPEAVRLLPGAKGPSFQFFFKKAEPILAAEKEVKLVVKMGPMTVEAKFRPKDMVFADALAL